jgi:hypothetical protein
MNPHPQINSVHPENLENHGLISMGLFSEEKFNGSPLFDIFKIEIKRIIAINLNVTGYFN